MRRTSRARADPRRAGERAARAVDRTGRRADAGARRGRRTPLHDRDGADRGSSTRPLWQSVRARRCRDDPRRGRGPSPSTALEHPRDRRAGRRWRVHPRADRVHVDRRIHRLRRGRRRIAAALARRGGRSADRLLGLRRVRRQSRADDDAATRRRAPRGGVTVAVLRVRRHRPGRLRSGARRDACGTRRRRHDRARRQLRAAMRQRCLAGASPARRQLRAAMRQRCLAGQARLVDNSALPCGSAASPGQARLVDRIASRGYRWGQSNGT